MSVHSCNSPCLRHCPPHWCLNDAGLARVDHIWPFSSVHSTVPTKSIDSKSLIGRILGRPFQGLTVGRLEEVATHPMLNSIRHLKTVRGHHSPVYCLAIDRQGRLAISGADDSFVKVQLMLSLLMITSCDEIFGLKTSPDLTAMALLLCVLQHLCL